MVLVTGAAGFIGARFVESCLRRGDQVVSVDHPDYFTERTEHASIGFGETVDHAGQEPEARPFILDRDKLFAHLDQNTLNLSAIVHLGACSDTTELDVAYLREVNFEYSQRLWSFAASHRVPFVYASSAATYGDGEQGYDDDEAKIPALRPLNPYGQSKQDFDVWALGEEKRGSTPPTWAGFKFFNVYGFGERHKLKMASVVLHAFDQIKKTGRVRLFRSHKPGIADGHQKRDFVYIDDVVRILHFAAEKPIARGIFNLGSGHARTFLDLVTSVFHELGAPVNIDFIDTPVEIRSRYQYFTEAKMARLREAGYAQPFTTLEQGVRAYVRELARH